MRLLLVDDDPDFRSAMAEGLRRAGYEVDTAVGGAEGWASFTEQDYPVVLVDWLMPELDGLELCRRIRNSQRPGYTWVILVSGLGGTDRYLEGMEAGADDFVVKPCDPRELDARLRVARRVPVAEVPAIAAVIDSVERRLGKEGRLLVRYSGTEPLLRIMLEGRDQKEIDAWAHEIADAARAALGAG